MTFGGRWEPVCGRSSIIVSLVIKKRTIQRDDEEQAEDDDDEEKINAVQLPNLNTFKQR